ncbi:MAG: protein-L-isoaspartate O-methyltransferase [Gammaproteobacteria bacterium]|nr:protein-L-isoaspartate O-methyltransferase [Gammaproteobacteria bacterium]
MNIDFARLQMVNQQVRGWNVYDEDILSMLRQLPRERFVPSGFEALAFADTEIGIGHDQYMMTPTVEGRVLQALGLDGDERVLEVGTGSGFLTACLARLAAHVTSIDIYDDFREAAANKLESCGIGNVDLLEMDAMQELPAGGFDAIAVTGSLQSFDPRFVEALNPHGKLFVVVGTAPAMRAKLVERTSENDWQTVSLFETTLAPLVNSASPPQFSF